MASSGYSYCHLCNLISGVDAIASDLKHDELLGMAAAANTMRNKTSPAAVWRWCRKGVLAGDGRRIYLKHCRRGGKLFTTREALDDFYKDNCTARIIPALPP